ncbi:MAG: MBL fold metallo-hydrolase [Deltaproteobacteria bacterium]|nr:MBL fold metallo-hydrolase [Deltaproteobacteria bacterium]
METGIREISDDIFMITLPITYEPRHVNVFAIMKDGLVSLIDTGPNFPGVFAALESVLGKIGRKTKEIDQIFVTHSHSDHCGLAGAIQKISGAEVYMHEMEYRRSMVDEKMLYNSMRSFYHQGGLSHAIFERGLKTRKMWNEATLPFNEMDFLVPGDSIRVKNEIVEVIHCPGHTAGHVVFFIRERALLFSGDHVLPHITPNLSPDLTNHLFRPLMSFINSLDNIRDLPVSMVYPAHGKPFTNLKERIEDMKSHLNERKILIINSLSAGLKTAYEITEYVFGVDLSDYDKLLAFDETYSYLMELESESLIRCKLLNSKSVYILL